jgi:hypothetical protein
LFITFDLQQITTNIPALQAATSPQKKKTIHPLDSDSYRDLSIIYRKAHSCGMTAVLPKHRAMSFSEGKTLTVCHSEE